MRICIDPMVVLYVASNPLLFRQDSKNIDMQRVLSCIYCLLCLLAPLSFQREREGSFISGGYYQYQLTSSSSFLNNTSFNF